MGSNASNSNAGDDGAPDVSDIPYTTLGPVSRVYVSEAAWQAKTRAERQETLDLEPKLIEAALQQHQDNAEEAVRAQGQEAVGSETTPAQASQQQQQHETAMEAIQAQVDNQAAQLAMETSFDLSQRATRAVGNFHLGGTGVVTTVRREVQYGSNGSNAMAAFNL